MWKRYVLYPLVGLSLVFNALFVAFDLGGYVSDKVQNKFGRTAFVGDAADSEAEFEREVVQASIKMARSKSVEMKGQQYPSTILRIYKTHLSQEGRRYARYDYPTGFLLAGLSEYALAKRDRRVERDVRQMFAEYMSRDGKPAFRLEHANQAVFGLVALNLYSSTGDERYKVFADSIFDFLKASTLKQNGIIPYQVTKEPLYLVDTLGMVCPFLVRYGKRFSQPEAIELARDQVYFFKTYGTDRRTHLPFHQISSGGNMPLGPDNWGRGIGWYMYAVSEYASATADKVPELAGLSQTVDKLRTPQKVWTQFPGTTNHFDASPTVMILYSQALAGLKKIKRRHLFLLLGSYTNDGKLQMTSGDTMGVNQYSSTFGPSEVSQGFLMMLLAHAE